MNKPRDSIKKRVIEVKASLPKKGISPFYFHVFRDEVEESDKNKSRLQNVLQLRIVDEVITCRLEKLLKIINNKKIK